MKTIALSMIFSLAVIVCEGQTLFAPHFVTFDFQAPNSTNSLVPIAGVNRSVPLAGASYNPGKGASRAIVHPQYSPSGPDRKPKNDVWVVDTGGGLTGNRASGPDRKTTVDGAMPIPALMRPDRGNSLEHGPGMHDSLHDDSAFLPWHRGYFGLGGSAERILGEAKDETHKDW